MANLRDLIVRIACANQLVDALNDGNPLATLSQELRSATVNSLALALAEDRLANNKVKQVSSLQDELNYVEPYLRVDLDKAEKMIIASNALDHAMFLLANRDPGTILSEHALDGNTRLGGLADFAEACYRKHFNRSLAYSGLTKLACHFPSGDMVMSYEEYVVGVRALVEMIPEPGERNGASSLLDMLSFGR